MDSALDLVYGLVVVLHLIGMAGVVGGWLATVRSPTVTPVVLHGALTALVTGLILVGLAETVLDEEVNHVKITVKLTIGLAIAVLAFVYRKRDSLSRGLFTLLGTLGLLNVAVAVLW